MDIIVVGTGVAGLSAALAAASRGAHVQVITAGEPLSGSSWHAQGGIAAAVGADDTPALHAADTVAVGVGLNDTLAVDVLVEEGRRSVLDLLDRGTPFDRLPDGRPELGLEAGHSRRRILHAWGGATGAMLCSVLLERASQDPRIEIVPNSPVDSLIVDNGRVAGVHCGQRELRAHSVVLATGGYAGLWSRSTNPAGNRGAGLYLAWQAGATLADLEFVQFHPTALAFDGAPAFLLSEALRGEGAKLVDAEGRAVVDPLLPRDVVARAIARYMCDHGQVYLTLRHLDAARVVERFHAIARELREWGLDLARDLLPVAPAAHYCMGGLRTDEWGRTDVPGLYAAGELACTGVQGANRLASNSLLECLVFGERAALAATEDAVDRAATWRGRSVPASAEMPAGGAPLRMNVAQLGRLLDRDLGVEREPDRLESLTAALPDPFGGNASPDTLVVGLAARAALLRAESRGGHYRVDAPEPRPEWRGRILWRRDRAPRFEVVSAKTSPSARGVPANLVVASR